MKPFFKKHTTALCIALFFGLLISSCVSTLLKEKIPDFSDEISFTEPTKPFKEIDSTAYPSWKNTESQNVILIISTCDGTKYPVSNAHLTVSENIDDPKIESGKVDGVKLPRAVAKKIRGTVDDSAVEVQTLAFTYRDCVYLSALSGRPESMAKDLENWKKFLNSIELKK